MPTIVDEETGEITETGEPEAAPIVGDDEDEESEHETPADPEPDDEASSQAQLEEDAKKLEAEAKRHTNALGRIMGDDAVQLLPCPLCEPAIQGFRFPVPLSDEQRAGLLAMLGQEEQADYNLLPGAELCEVCNGHGECATPSHRPEQEKVGCPKCGFKGWTSPDERTKWNNEQTTLDAIQSAAKMPEFVAVAPPDLPAFDGWTRPRGHEFYGMNPVYMTAEQRARDWWSAQ